MVKLVEKISYFFANHLLSITNKYKNHFISKGKSVKDAIAFMTAKRPEIHITKMQVIALQKFKKTLKKG